MALSKEGHAIKEIVQRTGHNRGVSIAEACRLMEIARSTYYDRPERSTDDTAVEAGLEGSDQILWLVAPRDPD